ncbi:MAG: hypothetical protein AAFX79_01625 [Planctomycetota bacterium]
MSGLLPIWLVVPMAMFTLVVVAGHLIVLRTAHMPESRRRIRTANGWVMLIAVPTLAVAFGVVSTAQPRSFAMVWLIATALLCLVIALAFVDMANNVRIARQKREEMRREVHESLRRTLMPGNGREG